MLEFSLEILDPSPRTDFGFFSTHPNRLAQDEDHDRNATYLDLTALPGLLRKVKVD